MKPESRSVFSLMLQWLAAMREAVLLEVEPAPLRVAANRI